MSLEEVSFDTIVNGVLAARAVTTSLEYAIIHDLVSKLNTCTSESEREAIILRLYNTENFPEIKNGFLFEPRINLDPGLHSSEHILDFEELISVTQSTVLSFRDCLR